MKSFIIRKATVEDATAIANITYYGWQDTYRGIVSDNYLDKMNINEIISDWKGSLLPDNTKIITDVLENEVSEVIGYICYGKARNEQLDVDAEIFALYLLKEYQGKGLSAQLFNHAMQQLKEMELQSFYVSLFAQNHALNFYRKFKPHRKYPETAKAGYLEYEGLGLVWNNEKEAETL